MTNPDNRGEKMSIETNTAVKSPGDAGRRRHWMLAGLGLLAALGLGRVSRGASDSAKAGTHFEVEHTEEQWRSLLTSEQFAVLRHEGTEHAFSSPLDHEKRHGTFFCAGCALALFSSDTKFESGTGWPSFWKPLDNAVATTQDRSFGMLRTEVHCRRCGGHLGHVFDDGPAPTGLRYCMNGVALRFEPAAGRS
jgi:peptide-methionine (R)-S-oxide reductase